MKPKLQLIMHELRALVLVLQLTPETKPLAEQLSSLLNRLETEVENVE